MKKGLGVLSLLICILCLCGCESNQKDRDKLFYTLKKEKIIPDSMEQIDVQSYTYNALEWCETDNYYIYKDKDSKMIAITYDKHTPTKEENYNHVITIYNDVTINDDVKNISDEEVNQGCEQPYYEYQNGEFSETNRYELGSKKEYHAIKKSSLFKGKYYTIEAVS